MAANLPDTINERIRALPPEQQQEVLVFVDALSQSGGPNGSFDLSTWVREAREIRATLPETSDSVEILRQLRQERSQQ